MPPRFPPLPIVTPAGQTQDIIKEVHIRASAFVAWTLRTEYSWTVQAYHKQRAPDSASLHVTTWVPPRRPLCSYARTTLNHYNANLKQTQIYSINLFCFILWKVFPGTCFIYFLSKQNLMLYFLYIGSIISDIITLYHLH